jgi:hypothetical protein
MGDIINGKQVKMVRVYLEDFRARKYEVVKVPLAIFKKSIEPKFSSWVSLINKTRNANYKGYVLTGKNHLCRFCGGFVEGKIRDKMCDWCLEVHGTDSYAEFKKRKRRENVNKEDMFIE